MTTTTQRDYFFDAAGDQRMEIQNEPKWKALLEHVKRDFTTQGKQRILDIGCHTGGLLLAAKEIFPRAELYGTEPLESARNKALERIPNAYIHSRTNIVSQSIDCVVSHEVLYLIDDLREWIFELKRILRPGGAAYIALGSHSENTAWIRWSRILKQLYGHEPHIYSPGWILELGHQAGFTMYIDHLFPQPLRELRYTPPQDGWGEFESAKEMFEFHNSKYVFKFYVPQ